MEHAMTKKALDTWGGVGSLLAGVACVYFAQQHNAGETMWKVFMGFCVLLVLNGTAMILWANRSKKTGDEKRNPGS